MIAQYNDFLATLEAQHDKFEALRKLTMLEQALQSDRHKHLVQQRERADTDQSNRGAMKKRVSLL